MIPRIPKSMPPVVHKQRDGMSAAHLENVKLLPCLTCGVARPHFTVDPNHLMRVGPGERGLSLKTRDRWAVPACRTCHNHVTDVGDDERWYADRGFDARAVAAELWSNRDSHEKMRRVIFVARQRAALKLRVNA